MRYVAVGMAWLAAAFATAGAQDVPGQREGQKGQAMGNWEVRVWLMDKDKKDVDLKDVTATLMIEEKAATPAEKPTVKKTIPMQMVTPKADEKMTGWHHGQVKEVDGGQYFCELKVMKWGMHKGGEEREKSGGEKEKNGAEKAAAHTGPYFKAEVPGDVSPKGEFMASVTFTIKGETRTARGFRHPFMAKEQIQKFKDNLRNLETQINAGDWTQASTMTNSMVDNMRVHNVKEHDAQCWTNANDLKSAVDSKDKTKSLDALHKLQDHIEKEHKQE